MTAYMQNANSGSGSNQNQGGSKQGGLSWSTPPSQGGISGSSSQGGAKGPQAGQKPAAQASPMSRGKTPSSGVTGKKAGILFIGMIAVALIIWGWSARTPGAPTTPAGTAAQPPVSSGASGNANNSAIGTAGGAAIPQAPVGANNFVALSPQDAGMTVLVSGVFVSAPTWLVVYELSSGKPTRVLGAALFFPENNGKDGSVPLLRATQPSSSYLIGQSLDDGDRKFALRVDKEVLNVNGDMAGVAFKTK